MPDNTKPIPFGQRPAYPQQVRVGDIAAVDAPGLNIRQHVWLSIVAASCADSDVKIEGAIKFADSSLDTVLARLEQLA